jgi:hypothetical protein
MANRSGKHGPLPLQADASVQSSIREKRFFSRKKISALIHSSMVEKVLAPIKVAIRLVANPLLGLSLAVVWVTVGVLLVAMGDIILGARLARSVVERIGLQRLVNFGLVFFVVLALFMCFRAAIIFIKPTARRMSDSSLMVIGRAEVPVFQYRLGRLLECYRDILKTVDALPLFGSRRKLVRPLESSEEEGKWITPFWGGYDSTPAFGRVLVIRPFIRLFVETHIRRQLILIARHLDYELLATNRSENEIEQLRKTQLQLNSTLAKLFGWGRIRRFILKIPWLPIGLAVLTIVITLLTGAEAPSKDLLGKTLVKLIREWDRTSLVGQVLAVAFWTLMSFYCLCLLIMPIAATGFVAKKALFAGGGLSSSEDSYFTGPPYFHVLLEGFPKKNTYLVEDDVVCTLGSKKSFEFQVDQVFSAIPYMVCSLAAISTTLVVTTHWGWLVDTLLQIFPLFLLIAIIDERRMYQRRVLLGHT